MTNGSESTSRSRISVDKSTASATEANQQNEKPVIVGKIIPNPTKSFPASVEAQAEREQYMRACRQQQERLKAERLWKDACVPRRHAEPIVSTHEPWNRTFDAVRAKIGTGFLIALLGNRGSGKTQMAAELIRHATSKGMTCLYTRAMTIFLRIRSTYRNGSSFTEEDIINILSHYGLLVIDEIGKRGDTAFEDRMITHLIDLRYGNEKDTLLISNQTEESFHESVDESIVERLIETGGIVEMNWKSFRNQKEKP